MRSIRRMPSLLWPGQRRMTSRTGWRAPLIGIWRTADGGRPFVPAAMPVSAWGLRHERHITGRRLRHATASNDLGCIEAAAAGLRQTDGLLSAVDADARWHSEYSGDFNAGGPATVSTT